MSAPKARRIDFYPDEYIAGVTGTLTPEEQGVYWLVCSLVYSRGGPIDNDPKWLSRMFAQASARGIKGIIDSLVSKGKISQTDAKLSSNRAETELKLAQKRIETNRKHGALGGRPPIKINDIDEPNGSDDQNPTTNYQLSPPLPTTKEREDPAPGDQPAVVDGGSAKYAFETRHIRLTPADFQRWEISFPHLALRAELEGLDDWAGKQTKWYPAVAGALAKREREVVARHTAVQDAANGEAHMTPEERRAAQRRRDLDGIL